MDSHGDDSYFSASKGPGPLVSVVDFTDPRATEPAASAGTGRHSIVVQIEPEAALFALSPLEPEKGTSTFSKCLPALMTIEVVLKALDRYMRESNESDRRTAAMLGIKRATLIALLQGADSPQKCILARLAGFLRRVGYL